MITYILNFQHISVRDHVTLYQSLYFENRFPDENSNVSNIVYTDSFESKQKSDEHMRLRMLKDNQFDAAFFIGGMNGVEEEFEMFSGLYPDTKTFPIASTGGASLNIFNSIRSQGGKINQKLLTEYAYLSLFRSLINEVE